ncbi:MAG TPA: hypothetical protein VJ914_33310 [Pseudonocardiaceae bacterium]|nr:hypothetical protein [Pseudonocardiaceae bacterium]
MDAAIASLYGAFADKHSLFATVLRRCVEQRVTLMAADLASSRSPAKALLTYPRRQAVEAVGGRGCLSANVALDRMPKAPPFDEGLGSCSRLAVAELTIRALR